MASIPIDPHGTGPLGGWLTYLGFPQYAGPANSMELGPPIDVLEAIAYIHDRNYEIASGNPLLIQEADNIMLNMMSNLPEDIQNTRKFKIMYYGIKFGRPLIGYGAYKMRGSKRYKP